MTDIIERLRAGTGGGKHWMDLHNEAADEIERLRAEREVCGTGANCCYKEAMIESQAGKIHLLREALTNLLDPFHEGQMVARNEASGYVQAAVSAGERVLEQTK